MDQIIIDEIMQRHNWYDLVKPEFVESGTVSKGKKKKLLIFVHAYLKVSKANNAVKALLKSELNQFDLLLLKHKGTGIRNTSAYKISIELQRKIAEMVKNIEKDSGAYEEIVLMGYSAGAVLIRKAFLYGMGQIEDHQLPEVAKHNADVWKSMLPRLRLVLLAGINRGWSYEERPRNMKKIDYVLAKLGISIFRKLPLIGQFIMSLERGQPFVADMRVQWIRLSQSLKDKMPPVIQLLGSEDDVVDRKDNVDVSICHRFIFIPVYASGHKDVFNFDNKRVGDERKMRITEAISLDVERLKSKYQPDMEELSKELVTNDIKTTESIVFVMHGIRDNSDWCREFESYFYEKNEKYRCVVSSYGHFPMLHFLLFNLRKRNVRWFMDQYTEELARHPNADFNFVGHSNGTYLLAEALRSYKTMKFKRVCFMGSVVPSSFPWKKFHQEERVQYLRNDRGAKDWIVGVFPGMFQLIGKYIKLPIFEDIGDGGFRGFDDSFGIHHKENYYFPGGHAAPLYEENLRSIVSFILGDSDGKLEGELGGVNNYALFASRLCWIVWLLICSVLVGLGSLIYMIFGLEYLVIFIMFTLFTLATI